MERMPCMCSLLYLYFADKNRHLAASKNKLALATAIIGMAPATLRVKDKQGITALHRAASIGSQPMVDLFLDTKLAPGSTRPAAGIDASDNEGMTALMHAAAECHGEIVVLLLKRGADPTRRDKSGSSALGWVEDDTVKKYIIQQCQSEGLNIE